MDSARRLPIYDRVFSLNTYPRGCFFVILIIIEVSFYLEAVRQPDLAADS